jgi:arylsulfatase A
LKTPADHRMNRVVLLLFTALGLSSVPSGSRSMASAAESPNLVIFFIDDLGYADIRPFGQPRYATPHLDRLADEGRSFTDFVVSSAVCSASRAALMTGCYHSRVSIHGALGPRAEIGINADETTLAELCRQRGYATACIGKWHLGHHPKFLPTNHGFDSYFGLPYSNDMWPYHPDVNPLTIAERLKRWPPLPLIQDETIVKYGLTHDDQKLLTRQYTERAVEFIRSHRAGPFLLYLAHSMVHVPLHASEEFEGRSGVGLFGDVAMEVDWSVGQILKELREQGIDEQTLVIFTSDNGPWLSYGAHAGSALPLREGKGTSFEGGFRVPAIMRWPGHIPAGTTCDELASTIDVLPTVAKLVGAELPTHTIDGKDISPLMFGEAGAESPHQSFCYYYEDNELQAIRDRRWKLHFPHGYRTLNGRTGQSDGLPIAYDQARIELSLYDLKQDREERVDVADANPEIIERLQQAATLARADLGDRLSQFEGTGVRPLGKLEPGDATLESLIPAGAEPQEPAP